MGYYDTCPICGANLDPGERCTCQDGLSKVDVERERIFEQKKQEAIAACPEWMQRLCRGEN